MVGSEVVVVCRLQYANETLCSLKLMVQIDVKHAISCFEMISRLKVIGINRDISYLGFLWVLTSYLFCSGSQRF